MRTLTMLLRVLLRLRNHVQEAARELVCRNGDLLVDGRTEADGLLGDVKA